MKTRPYIISSLIALSVLLCRQNCAADISIPFFDNNSPELEPQEDPVACWAASMSAALKSKGVDLSQSSIKIALNGNAGASTLKDPRDLSNLLNKLPYKEGRLNVIITTPSAQSMSWAIFKKEIQAGNPLVVGYWLDQPPHKNAHLVVIYGATTDDNDNPIYYKIWDPEPNIGLRTARVSSFNQIAWFYLILKSATLDVADTSHTAESNSSTENPGGNSFSGNPVYTTPSSGSDSSSDSSTENPGGNSFSGNPVYTTHSSSSDSSSHSSTENPGGDSFLPH